MTQQSILAATPDLSQVQFSRDQVKMHEAGILVLDKNFHNISGIGEALLIAEQYTYMQVDDHYTFTNLERGKGSEVHFSALGENVIATVYRLFPRYLQLPGKPAMFIRWEKSEKPDEYWRKRVEDSNKREDDKPLDTPRYYTRINEVMPSYGIAVYLKGAGVALNVWKDEDGAKFTARIIEGYRRALWMQNGYQMADFPKKEVPVTA